MKVVTQVIENVISQMKSYGMNQHTINMMYYAIFKPIVNLHVKANQTKFNHKIVDQFHCKYEKMFEKKKISRSYFRTVIRALKFITSYEKTGNVDFSFSKKLLKFEISKKHMLIVNDCIDSVNASSGHKKSLILFMRHFFKYIETKFPKNIKVTDDMFRQFIIFSSKKYPKSISHMINAMRVLNKFLSKKGLIKGNTNFTIFVPKAPRTVMQGFYTETEIYTIINSLSDSIVDKRNKAVLLLGYSTGLRASDIINLSLKNIDWVSKKICIIQSKTKEPLTIPLNPTTMNAISDYILNARPKCSYDNIFLTCTSPARPLSSNRLSVMMQELSLKAKVKIIPGRCFHGLRRSFAINLSENNIQLPLISQMLGHKSYKCDRQYLTFNQTQTLMCAKDFSMVPITTGVYYPLLFGGV